MAENCPPEELPSDPILSANPVDVAEGGHVDQAQQLLAHKTAEHEPLQFGNDESSQGSADGVAVPEVQNPVSPGHEGSMSRQDDQVLDEVQTTHAALEKILQLSGRLTPEQARQLAAQTVAYKVLARGQTVPQPYLAQAMGGATPPPDAAEDAEKPSQAPPAGIDPYEAIAERDAHAARLMAARRVQLENTPRTIPAEVRTRLLAELLSLNLLDIQSQVRREVTSNMKRDVILETALDRRMYRRSRTVAIRNSYITDQLEAAQREALEKRRAAKHQNYMNTIMQHRQRFIDFHAKVATERRNVAERVRLELRRREEFKRKKEEGAERARMQALMEDNEDEYRKLVKEKKDSRLNMLLEKTDGYVKSFSELVAKRRRAQLEKEASDAAAAAAAEQGLDPQAEQVKIQSMLNADDDGDQRNYYELAHSIGEKITEQPRMLSGGQLKPYQMVGLEWMVSLYNNGLNGILADEMGLGKTIQSISLITYLVEIKKINGHFLVVVPLSTLSNWRLEFVKWAPDIKVIAFKGSPKERQLQGAEIRKGRFNVCLTTYEYVMREKGLLGRVNWQYLIVDEGHRIRNHESKLTQILAQHYHFPNRLLLTGTPLQNNLPELWGLMNFLLPDIFKSSQTFEEWFSKPFANTGESAALNTEEKMLVIRSLHKVLRPFLLRRMKSEVESQLPQKTEYIIRLPLTPLQRAVYNQIRENQRTLTDAKAKSINNTMMHLRKVCNHPYLFPEVEEAFVGSQQFGDHLFRTCAKFELLDRLLPKLQKTGHRVLLFSTMTALLTVLEDYLQWRQIKYLRLDGNTKADDRGDMLKQYNDPNSEYFIFLLSTRAGGLGLNLQTADTVIIYDSDWNPFQDMQAQDRAHRIGQKSEVRVLRLVTMGKDSIEEYVLEAAERKRNMDAKVIQAGRFDQKTSADERRRILEELLAKDEDKEEEQDEPDTWEEINAMVARTADELEYFQKYDEDIVREWGSVEARYVSESDVPKFFLETPEEEEERKRQEHVPVEYGRGRRERKEVIYTEDLISEEKWAKAVDAGTLEEEVQKRLERKRKREMQRQAENDAQDGQTEDQDDEGDDDSQAPDGRGRRARRDSERAATPGTAQGPSRKRARIDASEGPPSELAQQMLAVFGAVRAATDPDDGEDIAEPFMNKPSRKLYPDYYKIIAHPISLNDMRKKIEREAYSSMDDFAADMELMVQNARTYNEEESDIVRWVMLLLDVFNEERAKMKPVAATPAAPAKSPRRGTPTKRGMRSISASGSSTPSRGTPTQPAADGPSQLQLQPRWTPSKDGAKAV